MAQRKKNQWGGLLLPPNMGSGPVLPPELRPHPRPVFGPPIPPGWHPPKPLGPPSHNGVVYPVGGYIPPINTNTASPHPTKPPTKPPAKPPTQPRGSSSNAPSRTVNRYGTTSGSSGGSASRGVSGASTGTSRPRTFTDGSGTVRNVKPARTPRTPAKTAGPKVDPLQALVDQMISGMNLPMKNEKKNVAAQSMGNINQTNRLSDFYDQQVQGIQGQSNMDLGAMMNRAAELKGLSAETIAKNQEYLKSLMAPTNGGTGDAQVADAAGHTQSDLAGMNDQMAQELAGAGGSLNSRMGSYRVAGRAQQREMNQQELLARAAQQRELDQQMLENKAKSPQMLYEMRAAQQEADLKAQVAQAEWGLKQQSQASTDAYRQGQLAIDAARLEMDANKPAKQEAPGIYGNIPKRYDERVSKVYDQIMSGVGGGVVKTPWREAHKQLVNAANLNPTTAALLASKWFPESITSSNPKNIRSMLSSRGVSLPAQRKIITQYFGADGWRIANSRREGLLAPVGNVIDGLNGA